MQLDAKALADATAEIVRSHVMQATAPLLKRLEALEAIQPLRGEKGDRGEQGEPGRDGVGVRDGFVQREGILVLTLSDGTTRDFGVVVGKDGKDGLDGQPGRDGEPGKDGQDGFSLDDYDEWFEDGGRTLVRRFDLGENYKEFRHQTQLPLDRGVFKSDRDEPYQAGDVVTWGGSAWIAQTETKTKPDASDSGWRLMTKRGRDGKDAK